jgi:hypothetical protein
MRESLDSQLESTRLSVDSKMTSVFLELDRVHKLLQIRPTNSDFQQVCVFMSVSLYVYTLYFSIFYLFLFVSTYSKRSFLTFFNLRMNEAVVYYGRDVLKATIPISCELHYS